MILIQPAAVLRALMLVGKFCLPFAA